MHADREQSITKPITPSDGPWPAAVVLPGSRKPPVENCYQILNGCLPAFTPKGTLRRNWYDRHDNGPDNGQGNGRKRWAV